MSPARIAPTRSNLVRLEQRLAQVDRGATVLRRKREALVAELFARASHAVDARRSIDIVASQVYPGYLDALAEYGEADLIARGWPTRDLELDVDTVDVWGLQAVRLQQAPRVVRSDLNRGLSPVHAGPPLSEASEKMEELIELVLSAAPEEQLMLRLGRALARTTRQVNVLEQRVARGLSEQHRRISRVLEEREREERVRLNHLRKRRALSGAARYPTL